MVLNIPMRSFPLFWWRTHPQLRMPIFSMPMEMFHLLLNELDAQSKLALTPTNQYLCLLTLEKHDILILIKTALLDLGRRPSWSRLASPGEWMSIPSTSLPYYTCSKMLPRPHYGFGDFSSNNAGKRLCMTCCWAGRFDGTGASFRFDRENW